MRAFRYNRWVWFEAHFVPNMQLHVRSCCTHNMSDSPRIIRRLSILVSMCISVAFATASEGTLRAQRLSGGTGAIPKFEVVSVKLRRGYDRPAPLSFDWTPSGYIAEGMPLSWLIAAAYGTKIALVIQTPSWAASQRFDIAAKVGPAGIEALSKLTLGEKNSMLKQILDQRFHVRVHTESRLSPVYELSVLKQGSKLVALSKTTDRVSSPPEKKMTLSSNSLSAENMPIADLTSVLWKISGRKVIDKTGFKRSLQL